MQGAKELSNVQKELLKLYSKNISDELLYELKIVMGKFFAEKATNLFDEFCEEKGLTPDDMIKWTNEHSRRKNRS